MSPHERIANAIRTVARGGSPALVAYLTAGFPSAASDRADGSSQLRVDTNSVDEQPCKCGDRGNQPPRRRRSRNRPGCGCVREAKSNEIERPLGGVARRSVVSERYPLELGFKTLQFAIANLRD